MSNRQPDFEAEVRFLPPEEGGRTGQWGPPRQGYRCDIHWDDDPSELLWMIWPMFLDEHNQELPMGTAVPPVSRANFYIINAEWRDAVRHAWLRVGAGFHLCEAARRGAACRVTATFPHATA